MINFAGLFRSILSYISPRLNTEVTYFVKFKKRLNLRQPQSFNEKVLWLKLNSYASNPIVKQCADKYRVRDYIRNKGLGDLLCNLIAVYDSPDCIEWDNLPQSFAMKLNVGCRSNLIVRNKSDLKIENAKQIVNKWFKTNYWAGYSELQYKGVKRFVVVEEYIGNPASDIPPMDYKFYCMNGTCQYILVCKDRGCATERAHHAVKYFFLDRQWRILPYTPEAIQYKDIIIEKPDGFDDALAKAELLAKDFPFVRVDFYIENGQVFFGELTFTPAGGMDTELKMIPPKEDVSVDVLFGRELNLPSF